MFSKNHNTKICYKKNASIHRNENLEQEKEKKIVTPLPPKKLETKKNFKKNFNDKCSTMFFTYNLAMIDPSSVRLV